MLRENQGLGLGGRIPIPRTLLIEGAKSIMIDERKSLFTDDSLKQYLRGRVRKDSQEQSKKHQFQGRQRSSQR